MSRFLDGLDLRLFETAAGVAILRDGRCQWRLGAPLTFELRLGQRIRVPKGTVTDLASVPRLFWSLAPPDGPWLKAAVVHDHLYATCGLTGRFSRAAADAIFRQAMACVGVPSGARTLIWAAVRLGGARGWGR